MREILGFLLLVVLAFLTAPALGDTPVPSTGSSPRQKLVFLNWSDYVDPQLVEEFENEYATTVKQVYFETDDLRTDLLMETDGRGYDVVLATGAAIPPYVKRGWVARLDRRALRNLEHLDSRWADVRPGLKTYAVPYLWGTLGIAYRRDLVGGEISSWRQLFEPREALRGRIVMIHDARDTIGMALKTLGYSANSLDETELYEAEQLLLAQRPFVKAYSYVGLGKDSGLVNGDVWMAMVYNGDALTLQEQHPEIAYSAPREGSNIWIDYLMVMESSPRKELALTFINFLNRPESAAKLSRFLNFATPNQAAIKLLEPAVLGNTLIYPDEQTVTNSEVYTDITDARAVKRRNGIFALVTQ